MTKAFKSPVNIPTGSIGSFAFSSSAITSSTGIFSASTINANGYIIVGTGSAIINAPTAQSIVFGASAGAVGLGNANTLIGYKAGSQTVNVGNTAIGSRALQNSSSAASYNTAIGYLAGISVTGNYNIAIGSSNLGPTSGNSNLAIGNLAGAYLTSGNYNIAIGEKALYGDNFVSQVSSMAGTSNIAIGYQSGPSTSDTSSAIAIGTLAVADSSNVIAIGTNAQAGNNGLGTAQHNIAIGKNTSTSTFIGTVAIGTDSGGSGATVTANNQIKLGTSSHTTVISGNINATSASFTNVYLGSTVATGSVQYALTSGGGGVSSTASSFYPTVSYAVSGILAPFTGTFRFYNDTGGPRTIQSVRANIGTPATGRALIVDVEKNSAGSIFSSSVKCSIQSGSYTSGSTTGFSSGSAIIASGDYLTIDVTQVGNTYAGADLGVQINWS